MTEVVEQQLLGHAVGVPTGPNVASKAVAGLAAAALIAVSHNYIAAALHGIRNRMFHVHTTTDAADSSAFLRCISLRGSEEDQPEHPGHSVVDANSPGSQAEGGQYDFGSPSARSAMKFKTISLETGPIFSMRSRNQ
jgi:hypothetical protein